MSMKALSAKCGKLRRIVRTARAAVLAALLFGLSLPGWTPAAQAQPTGSTTRTPAGSRGQGNGPPLVWLKIMAFTDAPVVGADVRVSINRSQGRPLVDVQAATNDQGVFPVPVRSHPSFFRVSISGGTTNGNPFLGHLSADVVLTDPAHQIAVVNPVTTLVSLLLDVRPDLKLEGAQALVRSFLGLPENYSLGLALRESPRYGSPHFSPVALLSEAEAAGGLDAFEALLLQELLASPSAGHSFRPTPLNAPGGVASFIAEGLAKGVLSWAGGQGAGWVMQSAGFPTQGASSGDIAALQQGLADLQSSVDALSNQVAQLTQLVQSTATQTHYNTIVVPALTLANQVNGVESDLTYYAQACPPLPDGSTPTPPDAFCTNQKASLDNELNDLTIQQAYVTEVGYIQDNPTVGFSGMLHLYSLWLAQTKRFFRAADSTKMQNLYDYWDAVLTQAANLKVELLHENGAQNNPGGQKQLTDFLGNPNLSPPTTGTFQANQATNLKLIWPAVPDGTVVTTNDHTMWSLLPLAWNGGKGTYPGGCAATPGISWLPTTTCQAAGPTVPLSLCQDSHQIVLDNFYGLSNWRGTPSLQQWQAALQGFATPPNWMQTLIAQTKADAPESPTSAGFFNVQACTVEQAWTNTLYPFIITAYYQILLKSDSYTFMPPYSSGIGYNFAVRTLAAGEQYFWYN